jgi:pimeloyl-ACP methyl ester carboxylesterase
MTQPLLACDDRGNGPAVVLLHGFPLCRQMWFPQIAALSAAGFRVIAPDLPGFGASPPLAGPPSIGGYADSVIGLLDHLGIETAVVGGMSMGGYVLLDLAERYPQRLAAALFLVTRAAADDSAGKVRRDELAGAVRGGNLTAVPDSFEQLLFAPATLQRQPALVTTVRRWMNEAPAAGVVGGLLAMRDRADYRDRLPAMALPALVVGAAEDAAIPPAHAEALAGGLPDATLRIIPAAGHMANLEQPAAFNAVLLDFLNCLKLA